jgi:hypothetical protein
LATAQYSQPNKIYNGEVGALMGMRFLRSQNVVTTSVTSGVTAYTGFVMGESSFACVSLSDSAIDIIVNKPGSAGAADPYRNIATGEYDQTAIWAILHTYWTAVKETFPDAWGKPPHHSRLMHGIGLRSMGKLMDRIMGSVDLREKSAPKFVRKELELIADLCRWTEGEWDSMGGLAWNELQNVHKHHSMVSNFLIRSYMERRGQS